MTFEDKVIYQIYPKSFYDSNNDGLGDIKGITSKLDYLKYLGVDLIWMNPMFISPQNDNGYDVSDYYNIDPTFGTMEDLEELIQEAKKRNVGIMFDMVFNHTSTNHIWFKKALEGDPYYKDFYFFKKSINGTLPTNWESKFGGQAWEYVEKFDEYYLHLFDKTQADLNWGNPHVREELTKVLNYWIEKGIKGFRFDVINLISKDSFENDYTGVGKRFYTDGKCVNKYLHELNQKTFGQYDDIITVGEMSATTIENCASYTNPQNQELNMAFNFHHLKVDYKEKEKWTVMPFDFKELTSIFHSWQIGMQEKGGWNALFWNCHDQPRSVSRFGNDTQYHKESAKMLATAIHLQRGTPYIYQGEEIGMTNAYFNDIHDYRDVESINYYHILKEQGINENEILTILKSKSRDNARTPMQWTKEGGFSSHEPWIKMNPNCKQFNVEESIRDSGSILHHYRKLIQLRKEYPIISLGKYEPYLKENKTIFAFKRKYENEEMIVLNNFFCTESKIFINDIDSYEILLSNYDECEKQENLLLRPYESIVLYRKN